MTESSISNKNRSMNCQNSNLNSYCEIINSKEANVSQKIKEEKKMHSSVLVCCENKKSLRYSSEFLNISKAFVQRSEGKKML